MSFRMSKTHLSSTKWSKSSLNGLFWLCVDLLSNITWPTGDHNFFFFLLFVLVFFVLRLLLLCEQLGSLDLLLSSNSELIFLSDSLCLLNSERASSMVLNSSSGSFEPQFCTEPLFTLVASFKPASFNL